MNAKVRIVRTGLIGAAVTDDLSEAVEDATLVQESVAERYDVRKNVFKQIEPVILGVGDPCSKSQSLQPVWLDFSDRDSRPWIDILPR